MKRFTFKLLGFKWEFESTGANPPAAQFVIKLTSLKTWDSTHIYINENKVWWNCEYLARHFGTWQEAPHGDVAFLNSKLLGFHALV